MRARGRCVERAEWSLASPPPDVRALYLGATALAGLGERRRAMEWTDRARAIAPDDPVALQYSACVYARAGETLEALDCLEQAIALGYRHLDWMARDPDLETLHVEPRFRALMRGRRTATGHLLW